MYVSKITFNTLLNINISNISNHPWVIVYHAPLYYTLQIAAGNCPLPSTYNISIERAHVVQTVSVDTLFIYGTVNYQNKDGVVLNVYWEIVAKFYREFMMNDQQDNKVL